MGISFICVKSIKINFLIGPQEPVLASVMRQKLSGFGHVLCHDSLSKTILKGTLEWRLGLGVMSCSAGEMLAGQHQRVDICAHATTANNGLLHKRLQVQEDLYWIVPHVPLTTKLVKVLIQTNKKLTLLLSLQPAQVIQLSGCGNIILYVFFPPLSGCFIFFLS